MSNVFVDKNKIDLLANAISAKSGESLTLTLDEMVEAVDGIETGGGITPSGNVDISSAGVTDVTNYATATVPQGQMYVRADYGFETVSGNRKWYFKPIAYIDEGDGCGKEGFVADLTTEDGSKQSFNAVPSGTTITPTESSQTIGSAGYMMEGAVTVSAIPSNYVGSGITQRSSSDLTASGATVSVPSGYYANNASKAVASGTAGTPTATKGTVSNHAITVTPSVTNTAGYISGGTKTGTAVSVSASELVSGSQTLTENDTYDVTNLASVTVNVSGGGSDVQIGYADVVDIPSATSSISFTGLSGEPTSFIVYYNANLSTPSGTPYKVACLVYDGTDIHGQTITNTNNAQVTYDGSSFSKSYNNGTLTLSSSGAYFQAGDYQIIYSYDGTVGNIKTADVQVGSGATSITFTDLEDEPIAWYCIFKSNFSTSNGYQRVIFVTDVDGSVGMAMDSSAHLQSTWTSSYNNGSFTITSNGTNSGGYFHQPGYYQLTYVVADASPYEKKSETYRASTSAQTDKIEPSSGYDAMSEVNISVPAVTQTNLTADNIKSGTTISISNGQSNLWSVTGTYGGGGSSKNVQVLQSTTRVNASSLTKACGDLTVSKTGTYDVYWSGGRSNTSTSYTWGTRLYVDGSGYGTENTSWSNNCQSNHLSNVSLTANQKLSVYARGRTGSYYTFVPMLVIIES